MMARDLNDILRDEGEDAVREAIDLNRWIPDQPSDFPGDRWSQPEGKSTPPASPRFALVPFDELRPKGLPSHLVKRLLPRTGLVVIWGPPKCGKSYWMFDVAMHVALGWKYRGRPVVGGTVVYCAFEGSDGFYNRAEAFRRHSLDGHVGKIPFFLMARPTNLAKDCAALIKDIRAQLGDTKPVLIVLDTLNRSLGGSESKDEDMGAYVHAADVIREAFGGVVAIVHHSGVDTSRPRGHTSLTGAVDAQLAVKRDASGNIVVTLEFEKDGPAGATILSRLQGVDLGTDDDGDPITACIVAPIEGVAKAAVREAKLSKGARLCLRALREAIIDMGEPLSEAPHIPSNVKGVTVDQWREFAYRRGISASGEPRARRLAFQRGLEALLDGKVIGIWEPYVWLAI
jgi:hypothetical protein